MGEESTHLRLHSHRPVHRRVEELKGRALGEVSRREESLEVDKGSAGDLVLLLAQRLNHPRNLESSEKSASEGIAEVTKTSVAEGNCK
jgi:hypothetical protein